MLLNLLNEHSKSKNQGNYQKNEEINFFIPEQVQGLEEDSLNKIIDKFEKEFLQGQYKNRLWVA